MSSIVPVFPRLLFGVVEPVLLIVACYNILVRPSSFVADLIPSTPDTPLAPTSKALLLYQGNCYLLLALLAVAAIFVTTDPKAVRSYLAAVAIGDIGHIIVTVVSLGQEKLLDVGGWNDMVWANLGVSAFLFSCRVSYLLGLFGPETVTVETQRKKKQ